MVRIPIPNNVLKTTVRCFPEFSQKISKKFLYFINQLKSRVMKHQFLTETYTSETVPALRQIRYVTYK